MWVHSIFLLINYLLFLVLFHSKSSINWSDVRKVTQIQMSFCFNTNVCTGLVLAVLSTILSICIKSNGNGQTYSETKGAHLLEQPQQLEELLFNRVFQEVLKASKWYLNLIYLKQATLTIPLKLSRLTREFRAIEFDPNCFFALKRRMNSIRPLRKGLFLYLNK